MGVHAVQWARLRSAARVALLLVGLSAAAAHADVLHVEPGVGPVVIGGPAPDRAGTPKSRARVAAAPAPLQGALAHAGATAALSPLLLEAIAWAESRFRVDARSPAGAIGVMQLMPGTAAELGVDPTDPDANIRGGATYLRRMLELFDGDLEKALAAYNAGPAAVRRHNGVPPFRETRAYVAAVLEYMAARTEIQ